MGNNIIAPPTIAPAHNPVILKIAAPHPRYLAAVEAMRTGDLRGFNLYRGGAEAETMSIGVRGYHNYIVRNNQGDGTLSRDRSIQMNGIEILDFKYGAHYTFAFRVLWKDTGGAEFVYMNYFKSAADISPTQAPPMLSAIGADSKLGTFQASPISMLIVKAGDTQDRPGLGVYVSKAPAEGTPNDEIEVKDIMVYEVSANPVPLNEIKTEYEESIYEILEYNGPGPYHIWVTPLNPFSSESVEVVKVAFSNTGGHTPVNISGVLDCFFVDEISSRNIIIPRIQSHIDHFLFSQYKISDSQDTFVALNAVLQYDENDQMFDFTGDMLLSRRVLGVQEGARQHIIIPVYAGYPCEIAVVCAKDDREVTVRNGATSALSTVEPLTVRVFELANDRSVSGALETEHVTVDTELQCTPDNPLYLRWVNTIGGVEYLMFEGKHYKMAELKDHIDIQTYVRDYEIEKKRVRATIERRVSASILGVRQDEHKRVSEIMRSPRVEMFEANNSKWVKVLVDKPSIRDSSERTPKNIEYTFILPDVQTQI